MSAIGGKTELLIANIKLTEIIEEKGYFMHADVYDAFGFDDCLKKEWIHVSMDGKWEKPKYYGLFA